MRVLAPERFPKPTKRPARQGWTRQTEGQVTFAGKAWPVSGPMQPVRSLPPLILDGDPPSAQEQVSAFLDEVEAERMRLAPDEFLVLLLGYEAGVALDDRHPRHPHHAPNGPDALAWVVTPGEGARSESEQPPRLSLSVVEGGREAHEDRVRACREELIAGTLYQANLAHALDVSPQSPDAASAFFDAATGGDECPKFAVHWEHADGALVSLSPECLVAFDLDKSARKGAGEIRAFPIKGTRPRGATPSEDERLRDELANSPKDAAEHVMIVDLLRHDIGTVAKPGRVTVEHLARALPLTNVHHLESVIRGTLRDDVDLPAILRALCPGGSITGAPKSSAIDVIFALEPRARGPYTGTIGVIDASGRAAFNLLIRTWIRPNEGEGALHVGGGIVVDSDPAAEFEETLDKARAFGHVVRERTNESS